MDKVSAQLLLLDANQPRALSTVNHF